MVLDNRNLEEKSLEKDKNMIEVIFNIEATIGERNAFRAAQNYLSSLNFSKKGLQRQLKYEGYSDDEVKYAIDNCGADWREQAALSAQDYLKSISFSPESLKGMLKFDGYTDEEASYAVDSCKVDWQKQAASEAQSYLEDMPFSRVKLIEKLKEDGFSDEEAEYGVTLVGY